MALTILVWVSAALLLVYAFVMSTPNWYSFILFRAAPFVSALGLVVAWAMERGFIINTGAM